MARLFVLVDLLSGNVLSVFTSESDAWDALCQAAAEDGLESIGHLSLLRMEDDQPTLIAMEDELVQRVVGEMNRVPSSR